MKELQILAVNQPIAALVNESISEVKTLLQTVVNGFKALEIGEIETMEQVEQVNKSPELFLKNRMLNLSGGSVSINGLALSREKLIDLIELPTKSVDFIKMVAEVFNMIDDITTRCKKTTGINMYKFCIDGGTVEATDELKTIATQAGVTYAQNENQIIAFNLVKEVITKMNEMNHLPGVKSDHQPHLNLDPYLMVDPNTYSLVPNHNTILQRVK